MTEERQKKQIIVLGAGADLFFIDSNAKKT